MGRIYLPPGSTDEELLEQRSLLAEAIFDIAIAAKIADPNSQPNGPMLLLLAEDVVELFEDRDGAESFLNEEFDKAYVDNQQTDRPDPEIDSLIQAVRDHGNFMSLPTQFRILGQVEGSLKERGIREDYTR